MGAEVNSDQRVRVQIAIDLQNRVLELTREAHDIRELAEGMAAALDLFRQCAEGTVSDEAIDAANAAFDAWTEYPAYRSVENDEKLNGGETNA